MKKTMNRWWILAAVLIILLMTLGMLWHTARKMPEMQALIASARRMRVMEAVAQEPEGSEEAGGTDEETVVEKPDSASETKPEENSVQSKDPDAEDVAGTNAQPEAAGEEKAEKTPRGRILGRFIGYAKVTGTQDVEAGGALQTKSLKSMALKAVQSVGENCTITPLEKHSYGGWSTNRFQVVTGGNTFTGYCAQPSKPTTSGTYPVSELKNDLIKFLLMCTEEGPLYNGYGKYIYNEADHNVYAYAHAAISYAYCGDLTGLDANMGAGVAHMVEVAQTTMKDASLQKMMKKYTAYAAYNDKQDIVWLVETGPGTGYAKVVKKNTNPELTKDNPLYSLSGASFGIYRDAGCTDKAGTLTTKPDGMSDALEIDAGTYYVREDTAPPGYVINETPVKTEVREEETSTVTISDAPQCAGIKLAVSKLDQETGEGKPLGEASLEDAHFMVEYYAKDKASGSAARFWILKTDEDGTASMDADHLVEGDDFYRDSKGKIVLPLGVVVIKEVQPPKGYLLSDQVVTQTLTATPNGKTEVTFEPARIADRVIRGDLKFNKIIGRTQERLGGVPFKITSDTTGESHVVVTDENGFISTEADWNKHTCHTNEGKSAEDGVWFGEGSEPDDKMGALPYDTYTVEELECEANEGCKLVSFTVTIRREGKTIDGGTVVNEQEETEKPSIKTTVYEAASGTGTAQPAKDVALIDTVDYKNLKPGATYRLEGVLMDKESGRAVEAGGQQVKAESEFTAGQANGSEAVAFHLDARDLAGKEMVVFEKLFDENGEEVAVHEDLSDKGQTITFKGKTPVIKSPAPAMAAPIVRTGDSFDRFDYVMMTALAGMIALLTLLKRRQERED